jgi:hypothetical protein
LAASPAISLSLEILFVEPRQLRQDLQIAEHLLVEPAGRQLGIIVGAPENTQQFGVARISVNYFLARLKKLSQQEFFFATF